ncbi:MAG: efflux RND transporter periplasmic adaptor subunit [Acidobacteriota bacterium]|nr:efflux RND transporter periplasmic adaptor subunit [Acidobacteriota bacterium]
MNKSIKFTILMAVIFGFMLSFVSCLQEKPEDKSATEVVPVTITEVVRKDLKRSLQLTGDIEPWKQVGVVPNISGKVTRIYVQEGDQVRQGQLLAELDTEALRLQLEQAKAAVSVAQANYQDAKRNKERMDKLLKENAISEQQHEKIRLALEAAQTQLKQAEEALNLVQYQLDVSMMRAPFSGLITGKYINEGEAINPMMPGGPGVVTLMDMSSVKIKVNVPERNFREIHPGLKSLIRVDAYPDEVFEGEVFIVNPSANPVTRSFETQVKVPNPQSKLKAGMFARVEIVVEEKAEALTIPADAILEEDDKNYVFVVANSQAAKRQVKTGLQEKDLIEVLSGLQEGEKIVYVGKEMLNDGSAINIVNTVRGDGQ